MRFLSESSVSASIEPAQISENFSIAKLLSILMVATGHYFEGTILWVPVTVGLFIFAFSSGYFSANRYDEKIKWRNFWGNKVRRLLPSLMVVNLFLLALFLVEARNGLLTFHTLLAWFGLSGILDWLGIHNQSPFGNGLWFFTVLLIFYLVYPLLSAVVSTRERAFVFIGISAIVCTFGHVFASPPYALWLTVFGFCFGVFAGRVNWRPRNLYSWISLIGCGLFFLLLNYFGFKIFNS